MSRQTSQERPFITAIKRARDISADDQVILANGELRKVLSNTNGMIRYHRHLELGGGMWSEVPSNEELEVRTIQSEV